ncbi:MAG: hypothetical protein EOP45_09910 [Sphingobacteriaceae bacterium]|nr:MAG: hypothetical protein EOP45_09910 [Sphingobacteriaceae bacterium]
MSAIYSPSGHVCLNAGTQVATTAHYPFRFNTTAVVNEGSSWYNANMWSGNGSVFCPGFKGAFTFVWTLDVGYLYEGVIAKNATGGAAFDQSPYSGATLAVFSNGPASAGSAITVTNVTVTTKFVSTNTTDYVYFGLYNPNASVTYSTTRTGLHIYLDHI